MGGRSWIAQRSEGRMVLDSPEASRTGKQLEQMDTELPFMQRLDKGTNLS